MAVTARPTCGSTKPTTDRQLFKSAGVSTPQYVFVVDLMSCTCSRCAERTDLRLRRRSAPRVPHRRRRKPTDGRARRCATGRFPHPQSARRQPAPRSQARSTACRQAPRSSRRRPPRPQRRTQACAHPLVGPRALDDPAPAERSWLARIESPGRTTATTSGSADSRCRQDATPMAVPAVTPWDVVGSGESSFAPPKRAPCPAASRMPVTCMMRRATYPWKA